MPLFLDRKQRKVIYNSKHLNLVSFIIIYNIKRFWVFITNGNKLVSINPEIVLAIEIQTQGEKKVVEI